jgi:hypothetical protein
MPDTECCDKCGKYRSEEEPVFTCRKCEDRFCLDCGTDWDEDSGFCHECEDAEDTADDGEDD